MTKKFEKNKINPFNGKLIKGVNSDEITSSFIDAVGLKFKEGVATVGDLPSSGNTENDARFVNDTQNLYIWDGSQWLDQGDIIDINWGIIGGSIDNQTDLKNALDAKLETVAWTDLTGAPSNIVFENDNSDLLMNFNGTDGSTTITDDSGNGHVISVNGSAALDTAQKKYGTASLLLPGTVLDYIEITENTDDEFWLYDSNTDTKIFDFWIKFNNISGTQFICGHGPDTNNNWYLEHTVGSGFKLKGRIFGVPAGETGYGGEITDNDWHHIAIVNIDNEFATYVDGSQVNYDTAINTSGNSDTTLNIGYHPDLGTYDAFNGWIDAFRYNNTNLFSANPNHSFSDAITIPINEPFQATSGNVIAVNADGLIYDTAISENNTEDAVSKKHTQNTDTSLDTGGSNEISAANLVKSGIAVLFDGGGSALSVDDKLRLEVPFKCEIQEVTLLADQSGSVQIDIWKDTYANYPPTDVDSITASAVPAISAATKYQDSTLTGWTTTLNEGDILIFNVDSVSTITQCGIFLKVKKVN